MIFVAISSNTITQSCQLFFSHRSLSFRALKGIPTRLIFGTLSFLILFSLVIAALPRANNLNQSFAGIEPLHRRLPMPLCQISVPWLQYWGNIRRAYLQPKLRSIWQLETSRETERWALGRRRGVERGKLPLLTNCEDKI